MKKSALPVKKPIGRGGMMHPMPIRSSIHPAAMHHPIVIRKPSALTKPSSSSSCPDIFTDYAHHPSRFMLAWVLVLLMVGGLAVLIYFAATGKLTSSSSSSSSGSGSGGGLGSSTPPTYFLSVGSGDSFESPNVNPQIVDGGFVQGPTQSAYQPFVMTFTQALAGTGITYQGQNYDPPLSTTAPDGVQYGFLQPAHSNTVTMTTQVVGLTTGSQYQVSYYYSQRSSTTTDPNPFSTAMYMSFQVVLDGTVISSLPVGTQTNGGWTLKQPATFTYVGTNAYPTLQLSATGPSPAVDASFLIDYFVITAVGSSRVNGSLTSTGGSG